MAELIERLLSNGPVVTDGAWGTQMQQRGLPTGACPDEWNLSHPELVEEGDYWSERRLLAGTRPGAVVGFLCIYHHDPGRRGSAPSRTCRYRRLRRIAM